MDKKKKGIRENYFLSISINAEEQLLDIENFIAIHQQQPLNAIIVIDDFYVLFEAIEKNPWVFVKCKQLPHINNIYRKSKCRKWTVIFKVEDANIVVLAIIHGANQPPNFNTLRKI
jgi:plasmid stabilization system protein ParE